jgi:hypothetical protein
VKYTVVEEMGDGRSYCVIERDDGSTFGQIVDLRYAKTQGELDAAVLAAADMADAIALATEELKSGQRLRPTLGEKRTVVKSVAN